METKSVKGSRVIDAQAGSYTPAKSRLVADLQNRGEYEAACEALGVFWRGIGNRPEVGSLSAADQAEVLLRVGTLSGWLGSAGQIPGAQAFAKDLISESLRAFEALGDQKNKVAEAQGDRAICYWREGALDEGRVWFKEALSRARYRAEQASDPKVPSRKIAGTRPACAARSYHLAASSRFEAMPLPSAKRRPIS